MIEIDQDEQLSENFTLREILHSNTAEQNGIVNLPTSTDILDNIRTTVKVVMQPARELLGVPCVVFSGYRCLMLNRAVKGDPHSQHLLGEAVDFRPKDMDVCAAAHKIAAVSDIPFDQLIYEARWDEDTERWSEWIHISHRRTVPNRMEILTIVKNKDGVTNTARGIFPKEQF